MCPERWFTDTGFEALTQRTIIAQEATQSHIERWACEATYVPLKHTAPELSAQENPYYFRWTTGQNDIALSTHLTTERWFLLYTASVFKSRLWYSQVSYSQLFWADGITKYDGTPSHDTFFRKFVQNIYKVETGARPFSDGKLILSCSSWVFLCL